MSSAHAVDWSKGCLQNGRNCLSNPLSGRQDTSGQPLHQLLSKLLLRFVERVSAQEVPVEHPLKTRPQQQDRNGQGGDLPPDAPQLLLLLDIGRNQFKDVVWPDAQWADRRAELGEQLRVSQEGRTHRDNLIVVVKSSLCNGGQVFARSTGACLVRLERLVEGRQMPGHQREEDLLFMIEMPIERAF